MPIRFRCSHCKRLLGIATRKAGTNTICPHCGSEITVPIPGQEESKTENISLDDVDELLGQSASASPMSQKESAVSAPPAPLPVLAPADKVQTESSEEISPVRKPPPIPTPAKPQSSSPLATKNTPRASNSEDRPLFEGDVDEILGTTETPKEANRPKPLAASGMDALSLSEPTHQIVLSPLLATLLLIVVVILTALSFLAGYFLAPRS